MYLRLTFIALSLSLLLTGCGQDDPAKPFLSARTVSIPSDRLSEPFGIAVREGDVYISDGQNGTIEKLGPTGELIALTDQLDTPSHIAVDTAGDLIVADSGSNSIKRVKLDGSVEHIAGINGVRGSDDGPVSTATFSSPVGIAVGTNGKIFVADTYNDRIRVIENGSVRTLAGSVRGFADGANARFDTPLGLAVWGDRLLVADSGNRRIRVVEPDGRVWTLAGTGDDAFVDGLPLQASFVRPTAIAVSPDRILYIADGNSIRAIGRRTFSFVETISGSRRGFLDGSPLRSRFNRPSALALNADGHLLIADSDNGLVRALTTEPMNRDISYPTPKRFTPEEFRNLAPGRWPYEPPERTREIAGTLGEIRGEMETRDSQAFFHNGLDIPGGYGETAFFIRDEKVLDPHAAENFGTLRELLRLPTIGYVHICLGRNSDQQPFGDPRFLFDSAADRKANDVRVPRGSKFRAGEAIGTLNSMNHVHLIAGRPGFELNALDALDLPGLADDISPVIESVELYDRFWAPLETKGTPGRIIIREAARVVVRAFDRMNGNPERRRLAPHKIGFEVRDASGAVVHENWNISFEQMPANDAVPFVYADGSRSGATGETIFRFIASNTVNGSDFNEGFFDPTGLSPGIYRLAARVADRFGNISKKEIEIEVIK